MDTVEFMLEQFLADEDEPTTPGEMAWVPCEHLESTKCPTCNVCEACRGTGQVLLPVNAERKVI